MTDTPNYKERADKSPDRPTTLANLALHQTDGDTTQAELDLVQAREMLDDAKRYAEGGAPL